MKMPNKIVIQNPNPFSQNEITKLENLTGLTFTLELSTFFKNYAGGKPTIDGKDCQIDIIYQDGWKSSNVLVEIASFLSIQDSWQYISYLQEFRDHFEIPDRYVQVEKLIPIIKLMNATVYYATEGMHAGKIYYVDNGDFGILKISNSLDEFFNKLSPK
ncbi:SMI1/KNR4 family protein [Cochleicola gelatinilyticus]|uniref:Knr4/Smi1-like domain-containing protein n=1 Tax=Cochleicola gelatinilyticus TaxID=1763537 RepID=A0A167HRW5_9FLAO|nr:SMI1/KNR4 family protein [Cochleicola gelatinilyticus]OAB78902.1 hypothetical protein ULVI_10005 [Cochleicola gelatinilyticus]